MIFFRMKIDIVRVNEKRNKKIRPIIKTVMMTGYIGDDLISEAEKEGVNGIIYKPMQFDKLIALIEEYC